MTKQKLTSQSVPAKIVKQVHKIFSNAEIISIDASGALYNRKHKIAVFVPLKNADELTFALAGAGAGIIGNYTVCSFRVEGIGTFLGGKGSKPKAGKKGKFEMVEEVKIEMICETDVLDNVIDEIYRVHPYEEPAYEIYDVKVREKKSTDNIVLVQLKKKLQVKEVLKRLNKNIDTKNLPGKIRNKKTKQALIDFSGNGDIHGDKYKDLLVIRKMKTTYSVELK